MYSHIQSDTKKQELLKNPTKIEEIQEKKFIVRNWTITTCLLRDNNPNYQCLKITSCRWRPPPRMHSFTATTNFKSSRSFVSPCVCCKLCRMWQSRILQSLQHTSNIIMCCLYGEFFWTREINSICGKMTYREQWIEVSLFSDYKLVVMISVFHIDETRWDTTEQCSQIWKAILCYWLHIHVVQARPIVTNVFYRKSENEHVVHDSFLFRLLYAVQLNAATGVLISP